MPDVLHLHPTDNVCIAVRNLESGEKVTAGGKTVAVNGAIRMGHKVALAPIAIGKPILRYGQTIGFASQAVAPGDWIHTHNTTATAFERQYEYATEIPPDPTPIVGRTFQGYRRADGRWLGAVAAVELLRPRDAPFRLVSRLCLAAVPPRPRPLHR